MTTKKLYIETEPVNISLQVYLSQAVLHRKLQINTNSSIEEIMYNAGKQAVLETMYQRLSPADRAKLDRDHIPDKVIYNNLGKYNTIWAKIKSWINR